MERLFFVWELFTALAIDVLVIVLIAAVVTWLIRAWIDIVERLT